MTLKHSPAIHRASGPFSPEVVPHAAAATSNDAGIASALASAKSSTSPLPAIPPWIANRLANLDLNHDPIAKYFQHLAHERTPKSKAILVKANEGADVLNLDDELLDRLLVRLKLE